MSPRRLAPYAAATIAFALYLLTLNPTFGFIDKGELVAAASTLGIPHPTGYPTIMMLGYLATIILPMREVLALNVLSAMLGAAGVGVLSVAFAELLRRLRARVRRRTRASKKERRKEASESAAVYVPVEHDTRDALYGALGALFVGLTATWWNQANGFEVYSLHALMLGLVLLFFLRYVHRVIDPDSPNTDEREARRLRWLFALSLGLAFTNHLTVVLLAPGFLVYWIWSWHSRRHGQNSPSAAARELLRLVPGFVIGLLPYLYLPIRAAQDPLFNWGDPDSLSRLYHHVSGRQYQLWFMADESVFAQQTSFFLSKLPSELGYVGLVLAAVGLVALLIRNVRVGVMTVLLFIICFLWAGRYDILEIEPYYMLCILALGIWAAVGARWLEDIAGPAIGLGSMALLIVATASINVGRTNERTNVMVEDMTVNVLSTLPPKAVVISSQWDFWVSGSWYMQAVERMRPDVVVIDQELLRRSWYLDQMATWHPDVMAMVAPQVERFRTEVLKFEEGEPYDPETIQSAYIGMIDALIDSSYAHRPVFVSGEVPQEMGSRYRRVPNYLMLRLMRDSTYIEQEFPAYKFRRWQDRVDHYAAKAHELYARSSYARALYEAQFGRNDLAKRYYEHALSFDPGWDTDDVMDQALNSEEQTHGTIGFFHQLRAARPQ